MDGKSITSNAKIQKLKVEDINDGIRNICSLPKTVLEHILSFLPMTDAVTTSVLSKQWEHLWTSIPKFIFVEHLSSNRELFMDSIERMLLPHDRCSIKHFCLDCQIMGNASCVNAWLTTVIRCNVRNCTIRLTEIPEMFVLPRCLFTCHTLKSPNLDMSDSASPDDPPYSLRLPSQIYLPNLKELRLRKVMLLDEFSTQRLFCSPALKKLYIIRCCWFNLKAISISSPKLKHLAIVGALLRGITVGYS